MRNYTPRPKGPTQISHRISGSRTISPGTPGKIDANAQLENKRLREAAEIIAEAARRISSRFSRRIPASVNVVTNTTGTYVMAGGPDAPNAYPFDPPEPPSRHPLYGNRKHWYNQPYRPFLEEAAEEAADKAAEAYAKVIDDWAKELGSDRP
jgi:hypothetical protein